MSSSMPVQKIYSGWAMQVCCGENKKCFPHRNTVVLEYYSSCRCRAKHQWFFTIIRDLAIQRQGVVGIPHQFFSIKFEIHFTSLVYPIDFRQYKFLEHVEIFQHLDRLLIAIGEWKFLKAKEMNLMSPTFFCSVAKRLEENRSAGEYWNWKRKQV